MMIPTGRAWRVRVGLGGFGLAEVWCRRCRVWCHPLVQKRSVLRGSGLLESCVDVGGRGLGAGGQQHSLLGLGGRCKVARTDV